MKTLIINAHPDYTNQESFSNRLLRLFISRYDEVFPSGKLTTLNLYEYAIPKIEENQLLSIWRKRIADETLSQEEKILEKQSNRLLNQFKEHHRILIVSPLHNFNIPSRLKDYLDNILVARETFKYTENGSVGLMADDYKALFIQASGSIYTNDDRYTKLDFAPNYLKAMFEEIMGFDSFQLVRAQGTSLLSEEVVLTVAKEELNKEFMQFYS